MYHGNRRSWVALAVLALLAALAPRAGVAAPADWEAIVLPAGAARAPAVGALAPAPNTKLDTALAALAAQAGRPDAARTLASAQGLQFDGARAQAEIAVRPAEAAQVAAEIRALGGVVTGRVTDALLQAWLPLAALDRVAALGAVESVRRPAELVPLENSLAAVSEGLAPINAPAWHAAGYRGAGHPIAVIDGGFAGYTGLRGSELPASVTVRNFVDGQSDAQVDGGSPHGTACAEIIHDIAPDAPMYLAKISTLTDLSEAVDWAISQHVHIISTSLGFFNVGPGDGTGPLAQIVARARAAGILWATAAGNERQNHWGGSFSDPDNDTVHNFNGAQEVNFFGPGDGRAYAIPAGVLLRAFIRWDDWQAVDQDYALLLVRYNGSGFVEIARSQAPQNGQAGQQPTEAVGAITSGGATAYGFVVLRVRATHSAHFEMFVPDVPHLDQSVAARSLANLADAPDALTVAAVNVQPPFAQESYSSEGPANGPGGAASGGAAKPDIAAYANVSTSSYGAGIFNGTSAATPHVAGAAALLLSATPGASPAQLAQQLRQRAIDLGGSGADPQFGAGRLNLGSPPAAGSALSVADVASPEGNPGSTNVLIFTVTLQPAASAPVSVNYATANGTAQAPADYTARGPSPLVFAPGETSKLIRVALVGDRAVEPNETFQLLLSGAAGASIADGQATGTILNDDTANAVSPRAYIPLALAARPAPAPDSWATISSADFEDGFPAGWATSDDNGGNGGSFTWARRDCRAFAGRFGGWAVGGGSNGAALQCGSNYPSNALARMTYGPFSLEGATAAQLRYKLWLQSELNFDGLCALASIDGDNFYGTCASGNSQGWIDRTFDLSNVYQLGNLTGRSRVWVAFGFASDNTVTRPEGAHIDALLLRKCAANCAPAPVPPVQAEGGQLATNAVELRQGQPPVFPERRALKLQ